MPRPFQEASTRLLGCLRNIAFAAVLTFPAAMVLHAQDAQPDWLMDTLQLPADIEIISEREIGSSVRMFSFSTDLDVDTLLEEWEEELRLSGHTIDRANEGVLGRMIEFSGEGIMNAKIVVAPGNVDGRSIIEIDASLQ